MQNFEIFAPLTIHAFWVIIFYSYGGHENELKFFKKQELS